MRHLGEELTLPEQPPICRTQLWINKKLKVASIAIFLATVYAAAAIIGLIHAAVGSTVTLIWAPSGIALAALLLFGVRFAPSVAFGAFVANAWTGVPLAVAAGIATGNTLEALLGVWLLTRFAGFHNALDRKRDVFAIVAFAALASTMLSASIGTSSLIADSLLTMEGLPSAWLKWWLGDMMGMLVVAPAMLIWLGNKTFSISTILALEALVLGVSVIAVSYLIFGAPEMAGRGYYPAALSVFPFVIWGALRFGQRGTTLLTLVVSMMAVWGTTNGTGPFVVDGPVDSLVRWCTFAIVMAVTGLLLAASVAEQRRAQAELLASYSKLERQVIERTRALQNANTELLGEVTERRKLESELIEVSEVQQRAVGRELHDGLGQHLSSLALLSAALQQQLQERIAPETGLAERVVALANESNAMTLALARGLYPVAFEFGGLFFALRQLAEQTCVVNGIHCDFCYDRDVQIHDSNAALNLYRIAQEATNNALKHSKASRILIELTQVGGQYQLSISDDGIGIDFDHPVHKQGLGMHTMRYRARQVGGILAIEPWPTGGTRVSLIMYDERITA